MRSRVVRRYAELIRPKKMSGGSAERCASLWFHHAFGRGGKFTELRRRSNRPPLKVAATIRADIVQLCLSTFAAERALKCADHCVICSGRQVLVAALAIRPKLQHMLYSSQTLDERISSVLARHHASGRRQRNAVAKYDGDGREQVDGSRDQQRKAVSARDIVEEAVESSGPGPRSGRYRCWPSHKPCRTMRRQTPAARRAVTRS
jgi:hypothetical protein